jgi:hypothetical protein
MRGPAFSIEILQVTAAAGINNVMLIIIIETERRRPNEMSTFI